MGRRLGIIIGVNFYQDPVFRSLQYAENDTRAVAQWLVNTKGGKWAPADVQHVQGAYATRELVETLIIHTCTQVAGPGDLVFVYFAGHAFLDEKSGQGYLALANTRYQQPSTGLHLPSLVQQSMSNSNATHIVFMLDCFQTGSVWSMQGSSPYDSKALLGPTVLNALQQVGDRLICCSCRGNQLAPESGVKNLGSLAYQMISGLCGPALDPATKQITLQGLHAYLYNSLGEQQRPQLFGQERTPLLLIGDTPALISLQQSGSLSPAFSPGAPQAPPGQPVSTGSLAAQASRYSTATAQMTTGQSTLSEAEQRCSMLLKQARHLIQMQNPGEGFNCVEQALQIDPTNIAALILKGQLLGTVGRFEEALYVAELVLQLDPNNALVWSMRAALLTNTGQYQAALQAIERSLELDPNNPETYAIKTSIMDRIATLQNQGDGRRLTASLNKQAGPKAFFIEAGIQFLGLALGVVGAALPILQPKFPIVAAFVLQSLGLALLCINAARGSYLHGFARFLFTLFTSIFAAVLLGVVAILGGVNKIGTGRIYLMLKSNPALLVPVLFLSLWLALAAVVPLLLALGGLIAGLISGVRRKK